MPCQNGGVCIDGNNSFTCVCSSGFKGEFCQIDTRPRPQTTILPTTEMATNAGMSTPQTQTTTTVKIPQPSQKTTTIKVQPSTYSTVKYGTVSTPGKLPQTGEQGGKMEEPTMIAVIAVSSVVFIAVLGALVWLLVYFKKRSWRPRYHERGVSMENVSTAESIHGKWTSTVDIPGSIPGSKSELPPVEEIALPKKTENIYVTSPTVGLVNTGYNIDNMY
ncbi:protein delta homolog 2-like [Acanthaster planci]|uniref:Protein delta homolog 2-like n=1 Tax=Acanthaster planci TaxID=133434 RepID=A0A8B7ZHQ4_ACAPL|nr:protein delta homolog 2-like [Acanthaster planci]